MEGIVEGALDPGKLEEEPTQSELSGQLDYGNLIVKAPIKKRVFNEITSPLGVANKGYYVSINGCPEFGTGDIMGGINLISGDIDFDTGNVVTLLSGQSIQLATSKLGAPVASMTGELVDLSTTYGPTLTDGLPPTPEIIFPNLTQSSTSDENEDSEEESFNQLTNHSSIFWVVDFKIYSHFSNRSFL